MHWIILSLVVGAAVWDLRTREVPDWIPLAIVCLAAMATAGGWSEVRWSGAILGLLLGFSCSAAVFYLGGLGGADVKLVAALGAAVGPVPILCMLFWTALSGALLAIVARLRGRSDLAYVPAIAAGLLIQTFWPEGLRNVLLR